MAARVPHPRVDEILDARRDHARGHPATFKGYRNHARRVYNVPRSSSSFSPNDEDKAAIAAERGHRSPRRQSSALVDDRH